MVGTRIPATNIVVDNFQHVGGSVQPLFFLTHAHADHTVGLSPTWNLGKIYCSSITRSLVLRKFNLNPDLVIALSFDCEHQVSLAYWHSSRDTDASLPTVSVTLIDANHCPGAAMFLFRGYFGTVLHTGDFRFCKAMATHPALTGISIDHLYIDNTYGFPRFESLPSRTAAADAVVNLIRAHPTKRVVIAVDSLGKEELLHYIAQAMGMPILLSKERLSTIRLCGVEEFLRPGVFTSDAAAQELGTTRLSVFPRHTVTAAWIQRLNESDCLCDGYIAVIPSGWGARYAQAGKCLCTTKDGVVFRVPYSLHSSYGELVDAVKAWRPRAVSATSMQTPEACSALALLASGLLDPSPPPRQSPLSLPASLRNVSHQMHWAQAQQRASARSITASVRRVVKQQHKFLRQRRSALLRRRLSQQQQREARLSGQPAARPKKDMCKLPVRETAHTTAQTIEAGQGSTCFKRRHNSHNGVSPVSALAQLLRSKRPRLRLPLSKQLDRLLAWK